MRRTLVLAWAIAAALTAARAAAPIERISIDCRINRVPAKLIFDTGSTEFAVWTQTAEKLGVKVIDAQDRVTGGTASPFSRITEACDVEIMGAKVVVQFHVLDVPSDDGKYQGLIGWPEVKNNVWEIVLDQKKVSFGPTLKTDVNGWTPAAIVDRTAILCFQLGNNGERFQMDTGKSVGITLTPARWNRWRKEHPTLPYTLSGGYMPGVGIAANEEVLAPEFQVGTLIFKNILVTEANAAEMSVVAPGVTACLGMGAVNQLGIVLDGPHLKAYFKSIPKRAPLPNYNRLGAVFIPDAPNSEVLVAHVAPNSPASKAGLIDGDALLAIDKLDVTPWRTVKGILPLERFWTSPGGKARVLTIKRNGQVMRVPITLTNFLDAN